MDISRILDPSAVRVVGQVGAKKRLFQDLSEIAQSVYGIDNVAAFDALQEREVLGSTGVGHGVGLPHARLHGLSQVRAVFLRIERPMEFDAIDRQPVDLVLALFAPKTGIEHLKALAAVSRRLRDADLCAKLRSNSEPAALHAMLTEPRRMTAA